MKDPVVRLISAAATHPLRQAILRPGRPLSEVLFPGDDEPETFHLGRFADGELVAVASLYHEPRPQQPDPRAWRLRGMAVAEDRQRQSHGRALLAACLSEVAARGGRLLWCNARTGAVPFYRAHGFQTDGEEFVIPDVGPHYVMTHSVRIAQS